MENSRRLVRGDRSKVTRTILGSFSVQAVPSVPLNVMYDNSPGESRTWATTGVWMLSFEVDDAVQLKWKIVASSRLPKMANGLAFAEEDEGECWS